MSRPSPFYAIAPDGRLLSRFVTPLCTATVELGAAPCPQWKPGFSTSPPEAARSAAHRIWEAFVKAASRDLSEGELRLLPWSLCASLAEHYGFTDESRRRLREEWRRRHIF